MSVVLRIARRRTVWEGDDVQLILDTEFVKGGATELRPSVYLIQSDDVRAEVIQTHAEHAASFLRAPPKGAVDVDVQGLTVREPVNDGAASTAKFAHAREIHRELVFASVEELRDMIERLLSNPTGRRHPVACDDILDHAIVRNDAGDVEWTRALGESPAKEWAKLIEKRRRRLGQ